MARILFITPMWYEDATPTDAKVCNFFVDEWIKQGHQVVVAHYRSQFPKLYRIIGKMLPALRKRICGDNAAMNLDTKETTYSYRGATVFSTPIFKYIPHGTFSQRTLNDHGQRLQSHLASIEFTPDAIIGHFCNPTVEIIERLRATFPHAKTAVVFHDSAPTIRRILGEDAQRRLNLIDVLGYRSLDIKRSIEGAYKLSNRNFICYSGIASSFLEIEPPSRTWANGPIKNFLFVGRMVQYKHPKAVAEALLAAYPHKDFSLRYIGNAGTASKSTEAFVNDNKLNNQISFLGQIERKKIIQWYDQSDCFVMISDHEVFGLVYLEAMSRGCITIAGNNGGMEGIIKSGENGFLCTPGNVEELASIIKKINSMSAAEKQKMSDNAIQTAKYFSDKNAAALYLNNVFSGGGDREE